MMSLHTIVKDIASTSFVLIVLASCSDNSQKDVEIIKALNQTIVSSNQMMAASTRDIMVSFEAKLVDPGSAERAKVWYPKAKKIEQLSAEVFNYIERVKGSLNSAFNVSADLFEKLVNYKKEILSVDPKITSEFQQSLGVFTKSIDSSETNQKSLLQNYFKARSSTLILAILNNLQNNIRLIEQRVITFCYEQSSGVTFGPCITNFPIVAINSTIVQPGEQIEITSGVGSFDSRPEAEVFIYEKPVTVDANAIASFRFKAEKKPGKYFVPVKINFTNQDGEPVTFEREIEYTVANIQKQ